MPKLTPCQAGYNCPYCRMVDNLHLVCMLPKCPIEWVTENEQVYDRLTGHVMPFVARTMSKKQNRENTPLFPDGKIPIYERRHGNMIQMEPKRRV